MFAGRYIWWMLIAVAIFLFFSMCFDYVTWIVVAVSGCAEVAGSCGPIVVSMSGAMKPAGMGLASLIMVICTVGRLRYLRCGWGWAAAALVWFYASAAFPGILAAGWTGQLRPEMVAESLPAAFLFINLLCAYLAIPFEEGRTVPFGEWRWLRGLLWFCAAYGTLTAFAETPGFGAAPARFIGMPWLAETLAGLQAPLEAVLDLGTGSMVPAYAVLAMFAAGLGATLLPQDAAVLRERLLEPFTLRGSRR